jgi:hypothetical protein
MARHFGLKQITRIVIIKKTKEPEGQKIYSPASWRGKPERRGLSTR